MENVSDYNRETEDAVYFFTPRFYALDNFSAYSVDLWGNKFPTSEHAYQWRKYSDFHPNIANDILSATSAYATKKIADANKEKATATQDERVVFMEIILRAKTKQHDKVKRTLLETGERLIIENAPHDEFWGIGSGTGQNMLGKIWMKLRDEINTEK
ncbi:MAG: NADAR family protein [Minisyncoccia bacterium]